MSTADSMLICGDFGGIWDNSPKQKWWLNWLGEKNYMTLFVDGNHENFDLLNTYPVIEWHGGLVHLINSRVLHLMRGQVYNIDGKRVFTMGRASSHDIQDGILDPNDKDFELSYRIADRMGLAVRVNHVSWWKEELPSKAEYAEAIRNLDAVNWNVDLVVSHCCPSSVQAMLGGGLYENDHLTYWFEEISRRLKFKHWYFGHYHGFQDIFGQYHLRYHEIERIQ